MVSLREATENANYVFNGVVYATYEEWREAVKRSIAAEEDYRRRLGMETRHATAAA